MWMLWSIWRLCDFLKKTAFFQNAFHSLKAIKDFSIINPRLHLLIRSSKLTHAHAHAHIFPSSWQADAMGMNMNMNMNMGNDFETKNQSKVLYHLLLTAHICISYPMKWLKERVNGEKKSANNAEMNWSIYERNEERKGTRERMGEFSQSHIEQK